MRLVKWYALGLVGLLALIAGLTYASSIQHYRQLDTTAFPKSWVYEHAAFQVSDIISDWYFPLIGLSFLVGLAGSLREREPSAFSLLPVILVLVIGAFATFTALVSLYGVVTSNDFSATYAISVALQETVRALGPSLLLGSVLFAVVTAKVRRAS